MKKTFPCASKKKFSYFDEYDISVVRQTLIKFHILLKELSLFHYYHFITLYCKLQCIIEIRILSYIRENNGMEYMFNR
jgi:hypothetical protein